MLRARLLTAIVLLPIIASLIYLGGLPFLGLVASLATLAEIEFSRLLSHDERQTVHFYGIAVVWLCLLDSQLPQWQLLRWGLAGILLASLGWQVLFYGRSGSMQAWAEAIASGLYIGLCGSFLIQLRALPGDGLWWTLIALPVILFADSTAYVVGSLWGRRKLAPRLSSGKTLEGYASGIFSGALMGGFLGWAWSFRAGPASTVTGARGLVLGLLVATVAPMGDLAISVVKREAGVKDSGRLLPGHGGILDRLDSVLFAAAIGYGYIVWFMD